MKTPREFWIDPRHLHGGYMATTKPFTGAIHVREVTADAEKRPTPTPPPHPLQPKRRPGLSPPSGVIAIATAIVFLGGFAAIFVAAIRAALRTT